MKEKSVHGRSKDGVKSSRNKNRNQWIEPANLVDLLNDHPRSYNDAITSGLQAEKNAKMTDIIIGQERNGIAIETKINRYSQAQTNTPFKKEEQMNKKSEEAQRLSTTNTTILFNAASESCTMFSPSRATGHSTDPDPPY